MSVSVNQSEKFLSLDSSAAKVSSTLRTDSSVDAQDSQTFRATFEEQRAQEIRKKDRSAKVDNQENPKNKHKITDTKQDKLVGSTSDQKHIQGNAPSDSAKKVGRSEVVDEIKTSDTQAAIVEKNVMAEKNDGQHSPLTNNPSAVIEPITTPISEDIVAMQDSLVDESFENVDGVLNNINSSLVNSTGADNSGNTQLIGAAKAAVIEVKSGNASPLDGESVMAKEAKPILSVNKSPLQGAETPKPQESLTGTLQGKAEGDKSANEKIGLLPGLEKINDSIPPQNNAKPLSNQATDTSPIIQSVNSSVAPTGSADAVSKISPSTGTPATENPSPINSGTGSTNATVANNANLATAETKAEAAKVEGAKVEGAKVEGAKVEGIAATNTLSDAGININTGSANNESAISSAEVSSTTQNPRLQNQNEIANNPRSAELNPAIEKVNVEQVNTEKANVAQTQKVADGNLHAQSTATVDKNLNIESKGQHLNGKTETTHFVNSQPTATTVNANVPVDAGTANSRQSYTPDTGQVLDAQIKDVKNASSSQGLEHSDSEDITTGNKSPVQSARWTQSIEQIQMLGKSNSLQTSIPSKFGGDQWANAVADKVMWLSSQRIQSAEIRLDPPELGPMQVKVSVQQDQASVSFVSHHQSVREALDQNVFKLREQFGNEGLDLVDVTVSDHSSQQSMGNGDDSTFHGDDSADSSTDKELTQEAEVMELLNLVDHYV